jgi:hypothetical protein
MNHKMEAVTEDDTAPLALFRLLRRPPHRRRERRCSLVAGEGGRRH